MSWCFTLRVNNTRKVLMSDLSFVFVTSSLKSFLKCWSSVGLKFTAGNRVPSTWRVLFCCDLSKKVIKRYFQSTFSILWDLRILVKEREIWLHNVRIIVKNLVQCSVPIIGLLYIYRPVLLNSHTYYDNVCHDFCCIETHNKSISSRSNTFLIFIYT